jgi:hypothetical protein
VKKFLDQSLETRLVAHPIVNLERSNLLALFVDEQLRVADDVDEQSMPDLESYV